jgi:hypothetical protein
LKLAFLLLLLAAPAFADEEPADSVRKEDKLKPGAWEFGFGGAISNYGGPSYGTIEARAGKFAGTGTHGLLGFETMLGYTRQDHLNVGDLLFAPSYQWPIYIDGLTKNRGSTWPYFGLVGGVSRAWEGNYTDTRYPLGGFVGVRMMPNDHSAVRFEARFVSETGVDESAFVGSQVRSGYFILYSFAIVNPRRP